MRDIEHRVISKTPEFYCGWPTLTRRAKGQLLLVYSGGREGHVCPFGRVEMMRSDDNGETWTWPRTVLDGPIDDRDAGILETNQGTLLISTFTSLAYENQLQKLVAQRKSGAENSSNERLERWLSVHNRINAEQRRAELGQWMLRSTDGGITWSARYPVLVNSPHGPIQLADGRQLYVGNRLWSDDKECVVLTSHDDGQTWQVLSKIPVRDGDQLRKYFELHAVQCGDGRLIVHIRNHNKKNKGETLQCESTDGGESWTTPHEIGVWGLPSHLMKLNDGRLLMSYGYRRPPFGNLARVSDDGGRHWSEPLTLSKDGTSSDLGYPSTVQLDDDSLLTVWYEKLSTSPNAVLRQARWSLNS